MFDIIHILRHVSVVRMTYDVRFAHFASLVAIMDCIYHSRKFKEPWNVR